MYFLVPLLAPLGLLCLMGMAWIEDHLLPQPNHPLTPGSRRSRSAPRRQLTRQSGREARSPSLGASGTLSPAFALLPATARVLTAAVPPPGRTTLLRRPGQRQAWPGRPAASASTSTRPWRSRPWTAARACPIHRPATAKASLLSYPSPPPPGWRPLTPFRRSNWSGRPGVV